MQWEGREESVNVEDRRGIGGTGLAIGGGAMLLLTIIGLIFGINPQKLAEGLGVETQTKEQRPLDPEEEKLAKFTKIVFKDTEDVWTDLFAKHGEKYQKPTLVLYTDMVQSGCGTAPSAVGPFYCPADGKVYIDLSFYKEMESGLSIPGDFPRAYVLAHEVGHHVQRQLGYAALVDQARGSNKFNEMSVRLELQADYLAGVWAHHAHRKWNMLERGDLEEAIKAAFEIGDDRMMQRAGKVVAPHSFTHGSSKQRMRWFKEGYSSGDLPGAKRLFELRYEQL